MANDYLNISNPSNLNKDKSNKFIDHLIDRFSDHEENILEENTSCKYWEIDKLDFTNSVQQHATMHLNIHSIPAKIDDLRILIQQLTSANIFLDFICLCETFLNNKNQHLYRLEGYNLICKNREVNSRGGVAIFVKNHIQFKRREDLEINIDGEFESLTIETLNSNQTNNILVSEIYRVPNTSEKESVNRFELILNKISKIKNKTIIATDQNLDYLKIETNANISSLLDSFLTTGFLPKIDKPTRIAHTSATVIDNIYTNNLMNQQQISGNMLITDISDRTASQNLIIKLLKYSNVENLMNKI